MAEVTPVESIKPGDTLVIAGRIRMVVEGVKANEYGVEEGVTLYVRGGDGLTDTYCYAHGSTATVDRG